MDNRLRREVEDAKVVKKLFSDLDHFAVVAKVYTGARGNERSLIDYIAVDNRLRREVEDAKVVRELFSNSDHFAVVAKLRMRERWEFKGNGKKEGERRELASERLCNSEESQRCERKVAEILSRARVGMKNNAYVNEVFETFKRSLVQATEEVAYWIEFFHGEGPFHLLLKH